MYIGQEVEESAAGAGQEAATAAAAGRVYCYATLMLQQPRSATSVSCTNFLSAADYRRSMWSFAGGFLGASGSLGSEIHRSKGERRADTAALTPVNRSSAEQIGFLLNAMNSAGAPGYTTSGFRTYRKFALHLGNLA